MTPVYTDASSAILLEKAGIFEYWTTLFSVVFAPSVFMELTHKKDQFKDADRFKSLVDHNQIQVADPFFNETRTLSFETDHLVDLDQMDQGERETICLYLSHKTGFILTDDGKAARFCNRHQLPFINALLVPRLFWYAGYTNQETCYKKMSVLCRIGRYSDRVRKIAYTLNKKDLSLFLKGLPPK